MASAVVRGQAGDTLLDSYEAERIPVADSVIAFTDRLTKAGTLSGASPIAVGRRLRHAAQYAVCRTPVTSCSPSLQARWLPPRATVRCWYW
jgi:hypothetical protein